MQKRVTLFDICRTTGVSSATVSRVINGSPLVTEATRKRVLKAIQTMGYHPSHAARMLARQRTETLAVILPTMNSGFFAELLKGMDIVATEHQYHLLTAIAHGLGDARRLVEQLSVDGRADAMIVINVIGTMDPQVRSAVRRGFPVLVIGRPVDGPGVGHIGLDNQGGAAALIRHLAASGFRRLALIKGPADNYDAAERLAGALAEIKKLGLELDPTLVWDGDFTEVGGKAAVARFLATGTPLPEVIFAFNDDMALGARSALLENGLRIPEDVALAGIDDLDAARHVGLTTLQNPAGEIGRIAIQRVLDRLEGTEKKGTSDIFPLALMSRASTRRP